MIPSDKKPNILIVDDVPQNIQVAANILRQEDFNIAFAQSGEAALSLISSTSIHLILLDIMMPGIDGFEVLKRLQNQPKTETIPVIFLTAKSDTQSITKAFESGAADYVTKPFISAELLARVKTHLELVRLKRLEAIAPL